MRGAGPEGQVTEGGGRAMRAADSTTLSDAVHGTAAHHKEKERRIALGKVLPYEDTL